MIIFILAALSFTKSAIAQSPAEHPTRQQSSTASGPPERAVSELERGNLSRVAASAPQIQEVLVKEPGILVELKRWVAKEASDKGQVVDDDDLSDVAIFD